MGKSSGFIIILSLFILVTLSLIGIYFIAITQLGTATSEIYRQGVLVDFAKESAINIGYAKLLKNIRANGFFLPYSNEILFHGEDINANGKLDNDEDTVNNNGLIDLVFRGSLDIYSHIAPSMPQKEHTLAKFKVRPSYIIEKDNISISVFLKVIDASSKFNIKNSSEQIINNVANYLQMDAGDEFLSSVFSEVKKNEYGWFNKFTPKYSALYNFFTVYSYVDTKIVKNNNYSELYKKKVYSALQLYPKSIEFESFSPVNINTANYDVLYALINGLKGYYFKSINSQTGQFPLIDSFHKNKQTEADAYIGELEVVEITDMLARKLTDSILNLRKIKGCIKNFSEIENYLAGQNFERNVIDLLIANFNSSFYTYKYNVPYLDDRTVDRLQLINPTTTVSLFPTGTFEFHYDIFVVNNKATKVLYNFSDYLIVKLYDVERFTLNSDFKNIEITKTNKTLNGFALDIYPRSAANNDETINFDSYLGSSVVRVYDEKELQDNVSFYMDLLGGNIKPKIALGSADIKLSPKNFPKSGKLFGDNLSELGNVFSDGAYFDNFSSISVPLAKNFPVYTKLQMYELLMSVYKLSLLAELYNLAQAYPTAIKTIQACISSFAKPNRFLNPYKKPRVFFNIFSPITKDYYSYIYFFSFLYPNLQGNVIKPKVFIGNNEKEGKEFFFNFGDTAGLSQVFGVKKDAEVTISDGLWHNVAFCISNTDFRDIKKQLDDLGKFDVELFRTKDWGYGPAYYKKISDILKVSAKYVKIYIDGQEVTESITFPSDFKNFISDFLNIWRADSFSIGANIDNPVWNYPLDASLSHFVIWNKVLSEDDIRRFFAASKYYNESFSIILNSMASGIYFDLYSKDKVSVGSAGFTAMSDSNSIVLVKSEYSAKADKLTKINFVPEGRVANNFIMIDNITLFQVTPLFVIK